MVTTCGSQRLSVTTCGSQEAVRDYVRQPEAARDYVRQPEAVRDYVRQPEAVRDYVRQPEAAAEGFVTCPVKPVEASELGTRYGHDQQSQSRELLSSIGPSDGINPNIRTRAS